jgi:hypothetical protein
MTTKSRVALVVAIPALLSPAAAVQDRPPVSTKERIEVRSIDRHPRTARGLRGSMANKWRVGIVTLAFACLVTDSNGAAPLAFDFEPVNTGVFTPFTYTVGGLTATFSSPLDITGPRFSVQSSATTFFNLSLFSGKYLYPNGLGVAPLVIRFNRPVANISLTFATAEFHIASRLFLSAYLGATAAGTVSAPGAYIAGDTYPQGTISFGAAVFDRVELSVPAQGTEPAVAFLVDSVRIHAISQEASWSFEEGAGGMTTDSIAGHTGQLGSTVGADASDPAWSGGRTGNGLTFAGGQYVVVPNAPALSPATITVEAWVRSDAAHGSHEHVIAKGGDGTCTRGSYGLRTSAAGGLEFIVFGPGGSEVVSPDAAAGIWEGRWHFAVGTFDGVKAHLFVDGAEVGSGTGGTAPFAIDYSVAPDQRLAIGSYLGGDCGPAVHSFAGDIDLVGIWTGAMLPAAVAQRFASLNLPFPTVTTLTANPAGTSALGAPVVLTAAVTSGNGPPSGSVEFFDGATSLGTDPVAAGVAEVTVTTLAAGAHTLSASFTPAGAFQASASGPLTYTVTSAGPRLSIADASVIEGNSGTKAVLLTTTLSPSSVGEVTVQYATANGTASAGSDYSAAAATMTFAPGVTSQTIPLDVMGDVLDEDNETFSVTLSNPTGAAIDRSTATATIVDNDTAKLKIGNASAAEGVAAVSGLTFAVKLTLKTARDVTVDYSTTPGTATAGADYLTRTGSLLIPAGSLTAKAVIPVLDDGLDEADEKFTVKLSNPAGAALGDASGSGTIVDDDPLPHVSIADMTVTEADGSVDVMLEVTLSVASGRTVKVPYTTADGTAVAGADYSAKSATVAFAPGQTTAFITVRILGDAVHEPTEQLLVNLGPTPAAILDKPQAVLTIADNDP